MRCGWLLAIVLPILPPIHDARIDRCVTEVRRVDPVFNAWIKHKMPLGGLSISWEGHEGSELAFAVCLDQEFGLKSIDTKDAKDLEEK